MLLRPSVPWCFAVREVAFEQQQQQQQRQQQQQQEKVAKIFLFYRFQKLRQFLCAIFMLLRPSVPRCFAVREVAFEKQQPQQQRQQQPQQEKVAKIFIFYRFQKLR